MSLSTSDRHTDNILSIFFHCLYEDDFLSLRKMVQMLKYPQIKTNEWQEFHCSFKAATL